MHFAYEGEEEEKEAGVGFSTWLFVMNPRSTGDPSWTACDLCTVAIGSSCSGTAIVAELPLEKFTQSVNSKTRQSSKTKQSEKKQMRMKQNQRQKNRDEVEKHEKN